MGAGKVFAIIGGVLGLLSVVLYYIAPEVICLWRLDAGATVSVFLGGFGMMSGEVSTISFGPDYADDIILMIVSILIIGGSVLTIIAGATGSKAVGILGGIISLAGPILLLFEIIAKMGIFGDTIGVLLGDVNLLFGTVPAVAEWGIYIGSYLAIGGGVLGLIGGATV